MPEIAKKRQWLAEHPYILAIIITLLLFLWMVSGAMQAKETPIVQQKQTAPIAKVQTKNFSAQKIHDAITLYGRTEPNRITTLRAEVQGKIIQIFAKRGAKVVKGQAIVKISVNDLSLQLLASQTLVKQRELEYQSIKKLNKKGYRGRVQLAQTLAALTAAKATLKQLQLNIEHSVIYAPYSGVLNDRYVELGDYVKPGDKIALIADLNPLVVRAFATENHVNQLSINQVADIHILNKSLVQGRIRYIAGIADKSTNTFRIEVTINNPENKMSAGLSSEMNIPLKQVFAIKISPALLALDEQGNIGVKSVVNKQVIFTPIHIVKTEPDGIWLTGLGKSANIIVLGQGFVRAGDTVQISSKTANATKKAQSE